MSTEPPDAPWPPLLAPAAICTAPPALDDDAPAPKRIAPAGVGPDAAPENTSTSPLAPAGPEAMRRPPERPADEPVKMSTLPLGAEPALVALLISTPPVVPVPATEPLRSRTSPPRPLPLLVPADAMMCPPASSAPLWPTVRNTEPAVDDALLPEATEIDPEAPLEPRPVWRATRPLLAPEALSSVNSPLRPSALAPL